LKKSYPSNIKAPQEPSANAVIYKWILADTSFFDDDF
jgi:hypothetical protein